MDDFDERFAPLTEAEIAALPAGGDAARNDGGRIAKAKAIVAACRDITGTFVDAYLGSRCVDIPALPKGVAGWHEESRALVFPVCDEGGDISACQRLFFGADGVPVVENSGKKKRRTNGVLRGSALSVPGEGDVLICEGAEDGLSLWCATRQPVRVAFGVSNLGSVPLPDGAAAVIVVDNDKPGIDGAQKAAEQLTKRGHGVRITSPPNDVKDANELLIKQGKEAIRDMVEKATPWGAASCGVDQEITRLAGLRDVDYEQVRKEAASKLGIRTSILDKLVVAARPPDYSAPGKGHPLEFPAPEPWPGPVNGAMFVAELTDAIRKYVVLTENDALAAAMWILHAYCFDAFACTPRLAITAPEKRCGKTTLLDVIGILVPRPLSTANISSAATFRTIEAVRPSLLIDEADTFLGENEELRGILNSGHRAGGQVIRTVGDDFEVRAFSTHCPVAIAQIGKLPGTLADRSVHVAMKRRLPSEKVVPFRLGRIGDLLEVARKAVRWISDNAEAIRECNPVIPDAIFNRAADNWAPLLAIADVIGGDLPERARQAALAACGAEEEQSNAATLLADIREAFATAKADRLPSKKIVEHLIGLEDRPWAEFNHGKPMTQNGLAKALGRFGLKSKNLKAAESVSKGYELETLRDAFSRYCQDGGFQSATAATANKINDLHQKKIAIGGAAVAVQNHCNSLKSLNSSGVAVQNPVNGKRACVAGSAGANRPLKDAPENMGLGDEAANGWESEI